MIELIEMVEKHNSLITINYSSLGLASLAYPLMTNGYEKDNL